MGKVKHKISNISTLINLNKESLLVIKEKKRQIPIFNQWILPQIVDISYIFTLSKDQLFLFKQKVVISNLFHADLAQCEKMDSVYLNFETSIYHI